MLRINKPVTLILVVLATGLTLAAACSRGTADTAELVRLRKQLAGELRDSRLYEAAVEEYLKILDEKTLDMPTRANINYLIGRIYFEDLQDYHQAAAYYVRARALNPQGTFVNEASKNLVASLEKMGRVMDAKRQLDAATDLDYVQPDSGDVAVARIDGEPVWLSQIDREIQSLPPELQKEFLSRDMRLKYVRNYVGIELIYRAALREKYGDDPDIRRQHAEMLKKLVVDRYVVDKVIPKISIDTVDVRNFYLAHAADRYDKAPYDSVRAQVFLDYQAEKTEAAFSEYISELARAENVQFYEENVK